MKIRWHFKQVAVLAVFMGLPIVSFPQTAVTLGPAPIATFLSSTGAPLAGGKVYTYAAGTSIQQATYTDSTGTIQNSNPVVLDSAGRAAIWFSALAYKIVVQNSAGVQQYVTDSFLVSPFLAGNNSFIGNETHSGTETFNGAVTFSAGGAIAGSFSGSPTFSGNPTFSGTPIFAHSPTFSAGISTDTVTGLTANNGNITVTGLNASGAAHGEDLILNPGNGGPTGIGGNFTVTTGSGGATSGNAGNFNFTGGSGQGGNSTGGGIAALGGNGAGTAAGGAFSFTGGTGGGTAGTGGAISLVAGTGGAGGNGGDVNVTPGVKGAGGQTGSIILGTSGRVKFTVAANAVSPTCASTGIGGAGTCVLANYSTDTSGTIVLTPAAGVAANGLITLTFNQTMGPQGSFCLYTLQNGSGAWNARATVIGTLDAAATSTVNWDNNAVALTAAAVYNVKYFCRGEN